ncbi:MAG: hypothetical protein J5I65_05830 [Aridibacter famidurans]|nr:hypothetical protein [Aridibacter famidurans]
MSEDFEVSFNSPQCGWMSIGLKGSSGEFRTTTAYAPHTNALGELMDALARMMSSADGDFSHTLKWNRDPEEYDFVLSGTDGLAKIDVFEYPTGERDPAAKELVFSHSGDLAGTVGAFFETFRQLYEERGVDDFKENWHQEFPYEAYENLQRSLAA